MEKNQPLLAGAACVDMTPPMPVERGGSFRSFQASDIFSPITAQAVALGKGSERVIWVSCDLGNTGYIAEPFRHKVSEQTRYILHESGN